MPAVAGNAIGLNWGWSIGEDGWKAGMDNNLQLLELLVQCSLLDVLASPPGSPAIGDRYLIAASGLSGDFAGHANKLTIWNGSAWLKILPLEGWLAYVADENAVYQYSGSAWILWDGNGDYSAQTSGFSGTDPSGTILWRKTRGRQVTLYIPANVQGTSDSTAFTFTGTNSPSHIRPTRDVAFSIPWLHDNGADVYDVQGVVKTDGSIEFYKGGSATGFTASGTKGTSTKPGMAVTYPLD